MELERPISTFKEIIQVDSMIRVITHLDTDGLMSASIMCKTLKRLNQKFWITTVKQLETDFLEQIINESKSQKWKAVFFLDLGSGNLKQIEKYLFVPIMLNMNIIVYWRNRNGHCLKDTILKRRHQNWPVLNQFYVNPMLLLLSRPMIIGILTKNMVKHFYCLPFIQIAE